MPPKKVLQYQCDRCPSVWYGEESKPEPPCTVEIKADFGDGGAVLHTKFECLCPSCRQTVHALVKQVSRTLQKMSAVRVAKKKKADVDGKPADKGSPSSADTVSSTPSTTAQQPQSKPPAPLHSVTASAPAHAPSVAAAAAGTGSLAAGSHSKK